jgi:hypothetical protein
MNEGAKVFDVGVPFLESVLWCRDADDGAKIPPRFACDWVRACVGVDMVERGEGEETIVDFGRPGRFGVTAGDGEGDPAREKGLRRWDASCTLEAIVRLHEFVLWGPDDVGVRIGFRNAKSTEGWRRAAVR